jgi:hypothetical protein
MALPAQDKYFLRSLHQEIDLFDRKLAHMLKYDTFATETERVATEGKLKAKRELLARTARQLAASGIEFKDSELPRSFRTDEMTAQILEAAAAVAEAKDEPTPQPLPRKRMPPLSPFAGTILDPRIEIEAYKRNRTKAARASS